MQIVPHFVEIKMDIDTDISESNYLLTEIQRNRTDIRKLIEDIDIELQKEELMKKMKDENPNENQVEKVFENILHSNAPIKMIVAFALIFISF